jgi:flagellar FliJ protein
VRRFKFSLEPVLDYRRRIEDEKLQIFGGRQRELNAAQQELARLNMEFKRYSSVLRSGHKTLSSDELRRHYTHLEYLDRCIIAQHAAIARLRKAVEDARLDVIAATKERKVIDKLKDKRFEEHVALEAAIEQKDLDDANNRRDFVAGGIE